MDQNLARLIKELTTWPVHAGVLVDFEKSVGDEVLPACTPVRVGHGPDCTVPIPREYGIEGLLFVEPRDDGVWLHVTSEMHVQANVEVGGEMVVLRGRLADRPPGEAAMTSPVRLVTNKVIIRFERFSVLLHFDPTFEAVLARP